MKHRLKGAIAINSAIVTIGLFVIASIAGAYTNTNGQIKEVNEKIASNLEKQGTVNTELQVTTATINTKLDLLLKYNGIDPKQLTKRP